MFCKNCGKEIQDGTKFCEFCGAGQDSVISNKSDTNNNPNQSVQTKTYPTPSDGSVTSVKKKKGKGFIIGVVVAVVVFIIILVVIINAIVSAVSKNSLSVDDVKNSSLTHYSQTRKIGNVFENYEYFRNTSWEEFDGETKDGEDAKVVEFNASMTVENGDEYDYDYTFACDVTIQFYRDDTMGDDESKIYGIWLNNVQVDGVMEDEVPLNDYDFDDMLSSIYNNEIFILCPSDYGIELVQ
ncbi:MAG: zinc ribbon domain-containing protein [Oscillospiraceae bacterium]|nr:zinc ribbon domain-containing protein [Oscillospiraceae bacterium]MDY3258367.1 zinc ribbon domain-containing protein [Ruminococcus callidus]